MKTITIKIPKERLRERLGVRDGSPGTDGKPGLPGIPGRPGKDGSPDTGLEIIKKVNGDQSDFKIRKEKVEDLEKLWDLAMEGKANSQEAMRLRAGVLYLRELLDVDVSGVSTGQSIQWDGSRWIPYTPGATTTSVFEEVPTDSGDHINFTLAHTPTSDGIRLYRGGARQQAGVGKDYTLSGTTITLSVALATGEIIVVDYVY